ncbi:MAG: hypothetical protein RLY78_4379 [Pseudomonadota bacterium]
MATAPPLSWRSQLLRLLALLLLALVALQLWFVLRIALMAWIDPQSTTFQRSEGWRLLSSADSPPWRQEWVDADALGKPIQRAVIASEDAGFADHSGVEWDALESAWERNQRAAEVAARANARAQALAEQRAERAARRGQSAPSAPAPVKVAKVVGGSTITQQLAKNLFLSPERTALRKAQEFLLTFALEALLDKRRILTIYLNSVEFGEGVFGAQAAAQLYFRSDVGRLGPGQAARLAVLLPAPRRFQKRFGSGYLASRAATITARMGAVELP